MEDFSNRPLHKGSGVNCRANSLLDPHSLFPLFQPSTSCCPSTSLSNFQMKYGVNSVPYHWQCSKRHTITCYAGPEVRPTLFYIQIPLLPLWPWINSFIQLVFIKNFYIFRNITVNKINVITLLLTWSSRSDKCKQVKPTNCNKLYKEGIQGAMRVNTKADNLLTGLGEGFMKNDT